VFTSCGMHVIIGVMFLSIYADGVGDGRQRGTFLLVLRECVSLPIITMPNKTGEMK
jgi:hypothetical protein